MLLQTERLLLREVEIDDWRATYEYQKAPQYLRYSPWNERTERAVRDFLSIFMAWSQERPRRRYQLALVLRSSGELIGNCGIRTHVINFWEAELGYELDHRYWGNGYATEAARALLEFGFHELNLHRIYAFCLVENVASARVLQRIGMRYEGCSYENQWMRGRWWSTLQFAMLGHEWRAAQGRAGR